MVERRERPRSGETVACLSAVRMLTRNQGPMLIFYTCRILTGACIAVPICGWRKSCRGWLGGRIYYTKLMTGKKSSPVPHPRGVCYCGQVRYWSKAKSVSSGIPLAHLAIPASKKQRTLERRSWPDLLDSLQCDRPVTCLHVSWVHGKMQEQGGRGEELRKGR